MSDKVMKLRFVGVQRDPVLVPEGGAVTMGRAPDAGLRLDAPQVSSRHASVMSAKGQWVLLDQGSRNGTLLNGTLVPPGQPCELSHGDVITVHPFRVMVDLGGGETMLTRAEVGGEEGSAKVRSIESEELESLAGRRLHLLLDAAGRLHEATELPSLATAAVDSLLPGTGFGRASVLRGSGEAGLDVLASRQARPSAETARFSRTLLRAAAEGKAVRLEDGGLNMSESIVGAGVTSAMCVPVLVGGSVEGFVYLDSVGGARPGEDAAAFAQALTKLIGMGWGEIQRRSLADRQRALVEELAGAHAVQRRLMPDERGSIEGWRWRLHAEPGRMVAGDIVGAGTGPGGPWVFLGDVAGKGAAAGMLMASIQAHLASDLERGVPLREAMDRVNGYVGRHRAGMEFATMVAVRLDADGRGAEIVDAGHGLAMLVGGGAAQPLTCEGGPPIGVLQEPYQSSRLEIPDGHRLLLFSDGVNEQRGPSGEQLGTDRMLEFLAAADGVDADVEGLLGVLRGHSAGLPLADDVSLMSLQHDASGETRQG